ncbi:hypothetical protein QM480_17835 [Flectobacillus sp. DC10W]|uniref:Peptidase C39-like domain-containing protein n=1 Tax=Flectobacillus longus TaxID=2984207 RepID=A0ABT6YRJ5_9BACT|nr:hypothetical protein [Flectobacillus longus]MDI9866208.1 hypothetical protein [Flectobacillus longus]
MVNNKLFYQEFQQNYNSCVLAAFAVSMNYFNKNITPQKLFKSFCLFYDESLSVHENQISEYDLFWEIKYVDTFNNKLAEFKISGNRLMKEYFENSNQNIIVECRKLFSTDYLEISTYKSLPEKLKNEETILVASYKKPSGDYHSISIGFDGQIEKYFYVDTNMPGYILLIEDVNQCFKSLGDGLLVTRL